MMMMVKSSILGLLLLLLLLLSSSVSGLGKVLIRYFWQLQNGYTWQGAQQYCRSLYDNTDLAIFYDQTDVNNLNLQSYAAWVGLSTWYYDWVWVDGGQLDTNFQPFQSWNQQNVKEGCAYVSNQEWFGATDCGEYYFFICHQNAGDKYTFINQSKTWSDALQYCRTVYDDLAILRDNGHLNSAVTPQDFPLWTGLYSDGATWKWSTGLSEYRNWAPKQPGNNGGCVAIYSLSKTMITQNCSIQYPFICYRDNVVLVKENKTWEEAMEYCETFTTPNSGPYQLVSVQPGDEYNYMMNKVVEADADEVWTGLRFLAGNWVFVNGADMLLSALPTCPVPWRYCGAFTKNNTGTLETRDCLDKKNFLCYSQW